MLDLLKSKNVLTQLAGVLFALLAAFHIALPPAVTAPSVVAVALLVIAAVSAISRFRATGDGTAAKLWWQSRTVWTAIVAAALAGAGLFVPALPIDQDGVLAIIMLIVGIANLVLHGASTRAIVTGSPA